MAKLLRRPDPTTDNVRDRAGIAKAMARVGRVIGAILLGFATLFYLQFGLQSLAQSPPQAGLTLLGTAALAWATFRCVRGRPASPVACLGTLPLFVFHTAVEVSGRYPDEGIIFLYGAAVAPVLSGLIWLACVLRGRQHGSRASSPQ
jgi:hypothetical protein